MRCEYAVIGRTAEVDGIREIFPARTKLAMSQLMKKHPIVDWYAQNAVGQRLLGGNDFLPASQFKPMKLIPCPICMDRTNHDTWCSVCEETGWIHRNRLQRFLEWQLADLRERMICPE